MDKIGKSFVEYVENNELTNVEVLNYYRNLFYDEPVRTERYVIATAINMLFNKLKENNIDINNIM